MTLSPYARIGQRNPRGLRWVRSFPARLLIVCGLMWGALSVLYAGWEGFAASAPIDPDGALGRWLRALVFVAVLHTVYWGYVRCIENRRLVEFGWRHSLAESLCGVCLGALVFGAGILVIALAGGYVVTGWGSAEDLAMATGAFLGAAYLEELISRAIVFRIVEDGLGTWWALLASAVVFGLMHAANPASSWLSTFGIALGGGILLGLCYVVTRRLWLAMGVHFGWNFAQGMIFGVPVSGFRLEGILEAELRGPAWLSGGDFGPEASVCSIAACLIASVALGVFAVKRRRTLPPFWARRRRAAPSATA